MSIFTTLSKNFKKNASLLYMKLYSPKAWSYQARGQEEPIGNHKHAFIINSILHYLAFFSHETLTWILVVKYYLLTTMTSRIVHNRQKEKCYLK